MLAANSSNEALEILRTRQLTPIGIQETLAEGGKNRKATAPRRVRSADLGAVCWQLSTMLEGGVTITTALDIIAEDTENLQLRQILQRARLRVSEGRLLSDGLSGSPRCSTGWPWPSSSPARTAATWARPSAPWPSTSTGGTASPRRSAAPSPIRFSC